MTSFSHNKSLLLVVGDERGDLTMWRFIQIDSKYKARLKTRLGSGPKKLKSTNLGGPVTAIAHRVGTRIVAAVGDTLIFDPFDDHTDEIQLGAQVRTMRFVDEQMLVVSTVQGLVSILLAEVPTDWQRYEQGWSAPSLNIQHPSRSLQTNFESPT